MITIYNIIIIRAFIYFSTSSIVVYLLLAIMESSIDDTGKKQVTINQSKVKNYDTDLVCGGDALTEYDNIGFILCNHTYLF